MSPKKLQVNGITNELEGASLYFKPPALPVSSRMEPEIFLPNSLPLDLNANNLNEPKEGEAVYTHESKRASIHESKPARTHASALSIQRESKQDDFIETIRKTVKQVGKEELFVRLTPDEKNHLRAVVYGINEMYRGKGRKTSDNEVSRIALKFLLEDYRTHGEDSILAITQAELNA